MTNIEFGELPTPKNRNDVNNYSEVEHALKSNPGVWARVAYAADKRELNRWASALRFRGLRFSQRKLDEGGWAVWSKYDR